MDEQVITYEIQKNIGISQIQQSKNYFPLLKEQKSQIYNIIDTKPGFTNYYELEYQIDEIEIEDQLI